MLLYAFLVVALILLLYIYNREGFDDKKKHKKNKKVDKSRPKHLSVPEKSTLDVPQDWVAHISGQAIDAQTKKSHAEFVKDRTQNLTTGRTWSPDSHDSYNATNWVGLRRPRSVPVGNVLQVPDVDERVYEKDMTFSWGSKK